MGFVDSRTHLFQNIEGPIDRQILFLFKYFTQRTAVQVLHHEVCNLAFLRIRKSEICDINDIRMSKPTGSLRFAPEPLDEFGAPHELRCNDLYRDGPLSAEGSSKVNGSHSAAAQLPFDL